MTFPQLKREHALQGQTPLGKNQLRLLDCFAKTTWIALGFALVCLSINGYAMVEVAHHPSSNIGKHGMTAFAIALWAVEVTLALLAFWLVRFAFSQPPRFLREP